jgi:hypothetical protein
MSGNAAEAPAPCVRAGVCSDPPEIGCWVVGPLDLEPKRPLELDPGAVMIPVIVDDALDPVERRLPYTDGTGGSGSGSACQSAPIHQISVAGWLARLTLNPSAHLTLNPNAIMIPVDLINDALDPVERRLPYTDGAGAPAPAPRVSPL